VTTKFFKIIKRITAVAVILAISLVSVVGCTFIQENKERVANQTLITVKGANNLTLTITQNELFDHFQNYGAQFIQYYGWTAEQAMDVTIESKVKQKYFLTVSAGYLVNSAFFPERKASTLVGGGQLTKLTDALTWAEYHSALYAVNQSFKNTIEGIIEEAEKAELAKAVSNINKVNIARIDFAESTYEYLKEEYFVGENIDTDKIKFVVYRYEKAGDRKSAEILDTYPANYIVEELRGKAREYVVTESMYISQFSTASAMESASFEIRLDEKVVEGNNISYEPRTVESPTYKVTQPRAHQTVPEEDKDNDMLEFGDIKVNRYATGDDLSEVYQEIRNISAEYAVLRNTPGANANEVDAYRQVVERLSAGFKDEAYIYNSAYESMITTAMQAEMTKKALVENPVDDQRVIDEFMVLYRDAKDAFTGLTPEESANKFFQSINGGISELYYYPQILDKDGKDALNGYFYVYQILFNFSNDQVAFVRENAGSNEALKEHYWNLFVKGVGGNFYMTTRESNLNYNPAFFDEYDNEEEALEKWLNSETDDKKFPHRYEGARTAVNIPSKPYIDNEDGEVEIKVIDILNQLEHELLNANSPEESFEIFKRYMYAYNDDPGVMNNATGYIIPPSTVEDNTGFYKSFVELAQSVFEYATNKGGTAFGNAFTESGNQFSDSGVLGTAFTDFGLHVIMVSFVPFEGLSGELTFDPTTDAGKQAILDYMRKQVDLMDGDTIETKIREKLEKDVETQYYQDFTVGKVTEDLHLDTRIAIREEKKINKIYKEMARR